MKDEGRWCAASFFFFVVSLRMAGPRRVPSTHNARTHAPLFPLLATHPLQRTKNWGVAISPACLCGIAVYLLFLCEGGGGIERDTPCRQPGHTPRPETVKGTTSTTLDNNKKLSTENA